MEGCNEVTRIRLERLAWYVKHHKRIPDNLEKPTPVSAKRVNISSKSKVSLDKNKLKKPTHSFTSIPIQTWNGTRFNETNDKLKVIDDTG